MHEDRELRHYIVSAIAADVSEICLDDLRRQASCAGLAVARTPSGEQKTLEGRQSGECLYYAACNAVQQLSSRDVVWLILVMLKALEIGFDNVVKMVKVLGKVRDGGVHLGDSFIRQVD